MKKKFRELLVSDKKYGYTIKNNCDGDGGNKLCIWENKKIIHEVVIPGHITITPKIVSEKIKAIK